LIEQETNLAFRDREDLQLILCVQILAKGPQISMGYKDNPSATSETYDIEGFLHTGDLGSIDRKGLIIIHDRIKELIKASLRILHGYSHNSPEFTVSLY
jgi:acyl-CoA synthetase (AMP-forming)/AMP-acid ligase II